MTRLLAASVIGLLLVSAGANADMENYFECTINDGKTRADIVAFKTEYEAAAKAAGLETYNLKVLFPIYADTGNRSFFWYGSFKDFEDLARVSKWFRASDWPAKFQENMTCDGGSLWQAID